jgi:NAD(P)-dependent dehydrogenase (short-subunit alcohol dehydrogenase family)
MKKSMAGKTFVITGAASGIGLALSRLVVSRGARLIGIGHAQKRCEEASVILMQESDNRCVIVLPAELSQLSSARELTARIKRQLSEWGTRELDALVLNAAVVPFRQIRTSEGFDTQWVVNYLSGFLLSHLLMAELTIAKNARLISVSSNSHYRAHMHWNDLQFNKFYHPLLAYKQSKLAQVLFTAEFNRRFKSSTGITALAADPGLVRTEIGFKGNSPWMDFFWKLRSRNGRAPELAAEDILFMLEDDEVLRSGQIYWKYRQPKMPNRCALDEEEGARLWDVSMEMAGLGDSNSSL